MTDKKTSVSRRSFLKGSLAAGAALSAPAFWIQGAYAGGHGFRNDPTNKATVTLGFNVPKQVHTPTRVRTNYVRSSLL